MTTDVAGAGAQAAELEPLVGAVLVSVDSGGLITAWTAQAERTFGWRRGEVIGHPLVATVAAPSHRTAHERDVERVLSGEASGSEHGFQIQARHRDGREFPSDVALVPVPLGRGFEFSAFLNEVGSREWTEGEVARLHERHRAVVDGALAAFRGQAPAEGSEVRRAAGALVLFRSQVAGRRSQEPSLKPPPVPEVSPRDLRPATCDSTPISADHIRESLNSGHFSLSCQPVLDLRTNEVAHFELLLRMTDGQGRLVLPQAFVGVAEQAGLMASLDSWLVRRAIGLLAEQQEKGRFVRLELSLSAQSLDDPGLAPAIEQELAATGAEPSRLVLGVSEQVASDAVESTAALAGRLRGMGCRFALRDFGSAFTAMRHLKQLPLDYLKLDGGLVSTFADSRTDQLVLKAIVDIAEGIGAETVAELVSDERTLVLLRQSGVSYAQGYHVGPPRRVSEVWSSSVG